MIESQQNQIIERLKRETCQQQPCLSKHQDHIEVIVFNNEKVKRQGLMCTACLIDNDMIRQLMPVEKYVLPIRKYLALIAGFYEKYLEWKSSNEWGPTVVQKEGKAVKHKFELFYNQGLKSALQLSQYADSIARKALQSLQKIHYDKDFDKLTQFLNQQNQLEQERMIISGELVEVCAKIRIVDTKVRYSTEDKIRKQTQQILVWYRQQIGKVIKAFKDLVEVHKEVLKGIMS